MIEEIWKVIDGFDKYEVSTYGRVRRGDKCLKPGDGEGQMTVCLCQEGRQLQESVHRLVAKAFLLQLPDKPYVCHNDGCYRNNYLSNLRWDTPASNEEDKKIHGTSNIGEANSFSKFTESDIQQIRVSYMNGVSIKDISDRFSQISRSHITSILRYEVWKHILPELKMVFFLRRTKTPKIIPGGSVIDDRGEISFVNDMDFGCIRRIYTVRHEIPEMIRAWHYHEHESKFVWVSSGTFLIGAVDPKIQKVHQFVISERKPRMLYIPAGYANGFKNLTPKGILTFFSTSILEESINDDVRYAWDHWDIWKKNYR